MLYPPIPSFADAPEIEQGETFIHTGEQDEVRIVCTVHSSPKAEITWKKDGRRVDSSRTRVVAHGNRHSLVVENVEAGDFGEYTCEASNQYGKAKRTTVVSGKGKEQFGRPFSLRGSPTYWRERENRWQPHFPFLSLSRQGRRRGVRLGPQRLQLRPLRPRMEGQQHHAHHLLQVSEGVQFARLKSGQRHLGEGKARRFN